MHQSIATQADEFEKTTGRTLGIVSFYVDFGTLPPMADVDLVADQGSLPMINMKCGAPDTGITAGRYDGKLRAAATTLKKYGGPVLFRWFWEMNLPNVNGHPACLGNAGAPGYIAAWRHIWTIFHQVGAANVAFVWCPSAAHGVKHRYDPTFYPGNGYVNWIGADMYDRVKVRGTFGQQFIAFYGHWRNYSGGKPIILCETGANNSALQQLWLTQIADAMTKRLTHVPGTPMKDLHGVVYWDGSGIFDYILQPGTAGEKEYATLAHEKYFSFLPGSA